MKRHKWFKGSVSFDLDDKPVSFVIIHNIPHDGNINGFAGAFQNWFVRTKDYTAESLVEYINSKPRYQAFTIEKFPHIITQ